MDILEKVIKGLECCMSDSSECYEPSNGKCPYYKEDVTASACTDDLFCDIYALLKAQEPVEPKKYYGTSHCGNCGDPINKLDNYGHECGRAVKWE